jgi:hypothetical protein
MFAIEVGGKGRNRLGCGKRTLRETSETCLTVASTHERPADKGCFVSPAGDGKADVFDAHGFPSLPTGARRVERKTPARSMVFSASLGLRNGRDDCGRLLAQATAAFYDPTRRSVEYEASRAQRSAAANLGRRPWNHQGDRGVLCACITEQLHAWFTWRAGREVLARLVEYLGELWRWASARSPTLAEDLALRNWAHHGVRCDALPAGRKTGRVRGQDDSVACSRKAPLPCSQAVGRRNRGRHYPARRGSAEGMIGEHLNEATIPQLGSILECCNMHLHRDCPTPGSSARVRSGFDEGPIAPDCRRESCTSACHRSPRPSHLPSRRSMLAALMART